MGLLTGDAIQWVTAVWENETMPVTKYDQFISMTRRVFDHAPEGKKVSTHQLTLKQGSCWVVDYVLEIRTLTDESGWKEQALKAVVQQGLQNEIDGDSLSRWRCLLLLR